MSYFFSKLIWPNWPPTISTIFLIPAASPVSTSAWRNCSFENAEPFVLRMILVANAVSFEDGHAWSRSSTFWAHISTESSAGSKLGTNWASCDWTPALSPEDIPGGVLSGMALEGQRRHQVAPLPVSIETGRDSYLQASRWIPQTLSVNEDDLGYPHPSYDSHLWCPHQSIASTPAYRFPPQHKERSYGSAHRSSTLEKDKQPQLDSCDWICELSIIDNKIKLNI